MNNLSNMLIAYRQKNDLSQRGLAKALGVAPSTMCRIEKGGDVDLNTFAKLLTWMIK